MRSRVNIIAAAIVAALAVMAVVLNDGPFLAEAALAAEAKQAPYDPPVGSRWKIVSAGHEEKTQDGKQVGTSTTSRTEELTIVEKTADGFRISTVLRGYEIHGGKIDA